MHSILPQHGRVIKNSQRAVTQKAVFVKDLACHKFVIIGETEDELDSQDLDFSYSMENPKTLVEDFTQHTKEKANRTTQDFLLLHDAEKPRLAGLQFESIDVVLPKKKLFSSFMGTFPDSDHVMTDFFELLSILTQMASIRTVAWRLAVEVKKTQRRVNALDKMVIPQDRETVKYIESVLEERERDNTFVLKSLKKRKEAK